MLTNELWNINNHFDTPNESIDGIIRATLYNEQMQRDYGFVEIKKLEGNWKKLEENPSNSECNHSNHCTRYCAP